MKKVEKVKVSFSHRQFAAAADKAGLSDVQALLRFFGVRFGGRAAHRAAATAR